MRLRILGCGTSAGVPRIGNLWGDCDPDEPRNRRSRASVLISLGRYRILVDTGPDMRTQLLDAEVDEVDAVIWTHDHADHCHGLDDLRQIKANRRSAVPCYARGPVLDILERRFAYAFDGNAGYPPLITAHTLFDAQRLGPIEVAAHDMPHGSIWSTGLKFSDGVKTIAYATDFSDFTDGMAAFFEGVDVFVIDALRYEPHPTHSHVAMSLDAIARCRPGHAYLTHMDSSMDYRTVSAALPDNVSLAYDGLDIEI